ncbi:branched-chain amino acid transport system II carrier protein [Anaerococcus sp. WCA-380-WT-2B]|uniref:Branched-chain amino acid transport system carrier protein n=1 Tax=Anaerococcus porci TaxID=2652269 RepID=A0A6N7VG12_9FIRM|nr:branched-chain amino acid transport system II carrier protein [Anaerococcus porci]MSS78380.1 branched-chain amino acid transport system II carrier protein [Anaerococcus porci]
MKKKLNFSQTLLIGSLLFGLYFGAGNLIFPIEIGQNSGSNLYLVTLGFIISGVGIPLLGVVASAISKSDSLFEMGQTAGNKFAYVFTSALYLTIGPFFAIPRTSTVAFEVGIASSVAKEKIRMYLLIFSLIFFTIVLIFSLKPGKVMDNIGKILTPAFLVLLSILVIFAIVKPMGELGTNKPIDTYQDNPLLKGILDGYNTMDALASLAFAIIIISSIRKLGVNNPNRIAIETLKSGVICLIAMSLVYVSLSFMASSSVGIMDLGNNGGRILSKISKHYLGDLGKYLLAAMVIIACIKTAIGLIISCSEMFVEMYPNSLSYKTYAILFTVVSFLIANLGLANIISLSIPVLMYLYPLAIVLIVLSLMTPIIGKNKKIFKTTILFTAVFSIFDFLKALPKPISGSNIVINILSFIYGILPGFSIGFGWLVPAIIGFIVGIILLRLNRENIRSNNM